MPIGPARMPLLDHLGELRMRVVRIVVALFLGACIFYMASPTIMDFLVAPVSEYVGELTFIDPFEGFGTRFKVSLWASLVATSPIVLWQILAFFLPALRPKERKWVVPTFAIAVALFILGTVFCYLIILDPAFQFLTSQAEEAGQLLPRAASYVDMIIKFEIGFGFAFELPLIVFYLVVFGVVPYKKLRHAWRTVYIALMVISAMITPDASPVTMLLMFAAMVALYELSLLVSRIVLSKRIKRQNEEIAREEAEERAAEQERARRRAKRLQKKG